MLSDCKPDPPAACHLTGPAMRHFPSSELPASVRQCSSGHFDKHRGQKCRIIDGGKALTLCHKLSERWLFGMLYSGPIQLNANGQQECDTRPRHADISQKLPQARGRSCGSTVQLLTCQAVLVQSAAASQGQMHLDKLSKQEDHWFRLKDSIQYGASTAGRTIIP